MNNIILNAVRIYETFLHKIETNHHSKRLNGIDYEVNVFTCMKSCVPKE